ncbi:MAG: exopolysaccharide biosynthesis polyprenyl glycosylphosphotransferase [Bacteroidetes bacterium]|nr:exopolysaccharide biosynthesis polyprenyl glycosylphosphotransferase [Bacteroidota bacterium]
MKYSKYITIISAAGDYIILNILFVFGFWILVDKTIITPKHILFYLYLNIVWLVLYIIFRAYRIKHNTQKKAILLTYLQIIVFFFFFFLMFFQFVSISYYPRSIIKYLFPSFFILLMLWKLGLYFSFIYYSKKGFNYRNVIIIGHSDKSKQLFQHFSTDIWSGYRCFGIICEQCIEEDNIIGSWDDLATIINTNNIDEVYIAYEGIPKPIMSVIAETLSNFAVKICIVPDLSNFSYKTAELTPYGNISVIEIHPGPLSYWYNQLIKRCFDLAISSFVIITILSWLTPILMLINVFGDGKGVFFRQKRTSIRGRIFNIFKYRSMSINSDADNKKASLYDDRVTRIGKFLRTTSLDELPQFINVFLGQMSFIGPRPHMLKHTDEYSKIVKRFMLRHTVKPGMTGLAQVNGYRGEVKKVSDIERRVEFDVQYIETWSIALDIKIFFLTNWLLLIGQKEAY